MRILLASVAFVATAGIAAAATVSPTSYDMNNGHSGSYHYWDESYDGAGDTNVDNAPLSGGTGDLTDGFIATQNWNITEMPIDAPGPYVGWRASPDITFSFAQSHNFTSVVFHFDVSRYGGVDQISSIDLAGVGTQVLPIYQSTSPTSYTFDLGQGFETDTLEFKLFRRWSWIMLSEVEFFDDVAPVPVPAAGFLLIGGLGALAGLRRRKLG